MRFRDHTGSVPVAHCSLPSALGALKLAFKKYGTVAAGNAPGVNNGAAALVVPAKRVPG